MTTLEKMHATDDNDNDGDNNNDDTYSTMSLH
jgi:hypothetical protein